MSQSERFTVLRATDRVWAIGAIHGDSNKLMALHDTIAEDIRFGDRVVYLGNYWGYGTDGPGVLEELLRFRNWFLSFDPFRHVDDLVYLRGAQEEMWWKLMQLQFAPNPAEVLTWMLQRGMGSMMQALGFNPEEGALQAKEGTLALTYWTNRLRQAARALPGHDALQNALKRAAYTDDGALLFVHAGLDIDKPLARQADSFWWAARSFAEINRPYRGFQRIVRGYDPDASGIVEGEYTISIDSGAGRGGRLAAVRLAVTGEIEQRVEI
jgi:serine/threonine protein phosphatase 1